MRGRFRVIRGGRNGIGGNQRILPGDRDRLGRTGGLILDFGQQCHNRCGVLSLFGQRDECLVDEAIDRARRKSALVLQVRAGMDGDLMVVDGDQRDHRSVRIKPQALVSGLLAPGVAEFFDIAGCRPGPQPPKDHDKIGLGRRPLELLDGVVDRLVRSRDVHRVHPVAGVFRKRGFLLRGRPAGHASNDGQLHEKRQDQQSAFRIHHHGSNYPYDVDD